MAEYIERDKVLALETVMQEADGFDCAVVLSADIRQCSTADVVEVKHGRWVSHDLEVTFSCSECDFTTDFRLSNYCPNCGAKMDGGGRKCG